MSKIGTIPGMVAGALLLASGTAAAVDWPKLPKLPQIPQSISKLFGGNQVEVSIQRPPESNVRIDGVAIAQPEGPACAQPLSTRLEQGFLQAGVTVVDRQKLDKVLDEYQLQASGAVDEKTAAKIGKMLGAQALIFPQVSRCQASRDRQENGRDKDGRASYTYITQANITGSVRVIALTTGQVMASQPFDAQTQLTDSNGYPDEFEAMAKAEEFAAQSVKKTLVPWTDTLMMAFNSDKQCELNVAYEYTRNKDFTQALEQSRANAESCATREGVKPAIVSKAHYNLGVMNMYFAKYDEALENFTEAEKVQTNKTVQKALSDCRSAQKATEALAAYNDSTPGSAKPKPAATVAGATKASFESKESTNKPAASGLTVKDRLVELDELCKSNLVPAKECAARRTEILKEI